MPRLGWLAVLVSVLHAQSGDFRMRLLDGGVYREREIVRVEIGGPSRGWQFAGFLVDPPAECGTMAKPCFPLGTGMQNGDFGGLAISSSTTRVLAVNGYVPRLAPGHYRFQALARRMVFTSTGTSTIGRYAEPPEYTTTEAVEFDVAPASPAWVGATIASCVATLHGTGSAQQGSR